MRSHLLNDTTAEQYRRSVTEGIERVAAKLAATDRPFTGVTVDALAPAVDAIDLDRPLHDTSAVLDELEDVYLRDAIYFHHPRYLAHLNCPVVIPAVLGEAVLSAVNSSLDTWDQSAGGTLIERRLIDWTAARVGLGPAADGVFTSGGSQSNLQALLLAREEAKSPDLARLRVFASEVSHFSVQKSAKLLGLGPDAVVAVPVDHDKRMRTVALARELERCAEADAGGRPVDEFPLDQGAAGRLVPGVQGGVDGGEHRLAEHGRDDDRAVEVGEVAGVVEVDRVPEVDVLQFVQHRGGVAQRLVEVDRVDARGEVVDRDAGERPVGGGEFGGHPLDSFGHGAAVVLRGGVVEQVRAHVGSSGGDGPCGERAGAAELRLA